MMNSLLAPQVLRTLEQRDLASLASVRDYRQVRSLPEIWPLAAERYGQQQAMDDPYYSPNRQLSYQDLWNAIRHFAAGLQALAFSPQTCVALFADNSHRWFIADQGILAAGGINAVRSAQADPEELRYIAEHSDSRVLVLENSQLWQRLRDRLQGLPIQLVILLSDDPIPDEAGYKMVNFAQLLDRGQQHPWHPVLTEPHALATLIYTSGTTGKPKGVMISHGNLLHQVQTLGAVVQPQPGDRVLGLLPTWHTFGRTVEYFLYAQGCTQTYTTIRHVKADFQRVKPHYMVGVPRIWESIYEGVQKQFREQPASKQRLIDTLLWWSRQYIEHRRTAECLNLEHPHPSVLARWGNRLLAAGCWPGHWLAEKLVYDKVRAATGGQVKHLVSGGGALPRHIDLFFEMINVSILVGYGLTETSPVLTARRSWRNLRGSSGQPIPQTELKIVDPETRRSLPLGQKGLVLARGPQIMQGYYKNETATQQVIDADGWFDTGDLGWLTADGNIVLTGRAKDTIVLTNGENIEPQPIEDACLRSPYIDQIVLVGQDQRSLGALIVPNLEALQQWAHTQGLHLTLPSDANVPPPSDSFPLSLEDERIYKLFRQELIQQVQDRPSYRPDDRIGPFRLILEPFSVENGMMTQTLKIRRPVVLERYRDMIDGMYA